jgi:GNAT superfamily N-acetyltransferase
VSIASLGYRTDLALLELGGTQFEDRGDHLVVRSPHNPTHWWGNFLLLRGLPAPDATDLWLGRFAETFPEARHLALGIDATRGTTHDLAAFAARGCAVEAQTVMTATSVHPPTHRNDLAECRALSTDDDWAQGVELSVRTREEGHEPAGYRIFSARRAETNRALTDAGLGAWFGAFLDGRLVSQMGLLRASDGLARFQSVQTDPDHRREGLAGTLVHHVAHYGFDVLGARTLVMVADPEYFAIDLYAAVGFAATEDQLQVERAPVQG